MSISANQSGRVFGCGTIPLILTVTAGVLISKDADEYLLELQFDEASRDRADLRPILPLTLRW